MADDLARIIKAHEEQITAAHAQITALESILVGLMRAMVRNGTDPGVIRSAFDFAESMHIANADAHPGMLQTTQSLQILEELRDAVVPK